MYSDFVSKSKQMPDPGETHSATVTVPVRLLIENFSDPSPSSRYMMLSLPKCPPSRSFAVMVVTSVPL